MTPGRRGMLLMVLFVAIWAAVEALAGRVLRVYSPYQVVFTRYAVHLALMLAVWGFRDPGSLWRTRRPAYQLSRSLLMLCMPASWVMAAQAGVDPGTASSIFWLSPLFILGFGRLVLGERAPLALWIAAAAAVAGAFAVCGFHRVPPAWLVVFPLAMAGSFSLYVAMTRSLRTETTRANLFYTALGVALALSVAMPRLWVWPSARDLSAMVAIGVIGFGALWALDALAAAAPVSITAPLAPLQLGFTIGLDVGLRRELPGLRVMAALALIGVAAAYAFVREPRLAVGQAA